MYITLKMHTESSQVYPDDGPDLVPVEIVGDGNCMARSASLLAFGTQDYHPELRARIAIELAAHEDFYLQDSNLHPQSQKSLSSAYAVSSDFYNLEVLTQDAIKQIFRKEVLTVCTPGKEMGMWQMHALSSIFRRPLVSVYPKIEGDWLSEYGNEGPQRQDLHRVINPRVLESNPAGANPAIMWTKMGIRRKNWRPNHFVACLQKRPEARCSQSTNQAQNARAEKRKAVDIRDFLPKKN